MSQMGFADGLLLGPAMAKAAAARGERPKVFDWDAAARILAERQPREAVAGLMGDLDYTAGVIWRDGQIVADEYTYLASSWATPVLIIGDEEIPCYVERTRDGWDAETKWPESARAIIRAAK